MKSRERRSGNVRKVAAAAVGGLLVAAGALVAVSGSASAGGTPAPVPPTATAVAECVGETGRIVVTIVDNSRYRYDISVGGKVAANVPDGEDGINIFEPFADGAYPVVVNWIALNDDEGTVPFDTPIPVLSRTVTVDCGADVTTTAPPTTAPPTTVPATTVPAAAAPTTVATLAGLLTLAGGALLLARRHPRRA